MILRTSHIGQVTPYSLSGTTVTAKPAGYALLYSTRPSAIAGGEPTLAPGFSCALGVGPLRLIASSVRFESANGGIIWPHLDWWIAHVMVGNAGLSSATDVTNTCRLVASLGLGDAQEDAEVRATASRQAAVYVRLSLPASGGAYITPDTSILDSDIGIGMLGVNLTWETLDG